MTQKELAIKCMQTLNIYEPYIKAFKEHDTKTMFEGFYAGYYLTDRFEPEVLNKVKKFEEETGCLVYAITHEKFEFGECYSFLIVSKYEEDWEGTLTTWGDNIYAYSYVWNKDVEEFSEFGTIVIDSFGGGIKRIG